MIPGACLINTAASARRNCRCLADRTGDPKVAKAVATIPCDLYSPLKAAPKTFSPSLTLKSEKAARTEQRERYHEVVIDGSRLGRYRYPRT